MTEIVLAPLDRSAWLGILWPAYNRGALWLLNSPEGLHGLRGEQRRACHQPALHWTWEASVLHASMPPEARDPQADIALEFRPDDLGAALILRVKNVQGSPYSESALFSACLRHASAWRFSDPTGERTLVRSGGAWVSLLELFGDEAITRARNMPIGAADGAVADEGIIARLNEDRSRVVACSWDRTGKLASNLGPQISCIHADPALGALAPGESVERRGRLWFGAWSLDELAALHAGAFA